MNKRLCSMLCFALALCAALTLSGCSKQAPPAEDVRPVSVIKVAPGAGTSDVSYTGDVRARYETALGFRVAGKIISRDVEVGSQVRHGQLLARLDPSDYKLNIEAAKSQLAAARSDFLQAEDDLKRYQDLYEKKFVSAAEYDRRKTSFNVAKARLEQAQAQLGVTQNQSTYTTLRADHDGIITAITAEVGQVMSAGQPVMKLARPEEKEVVISVPESRLDEIKSAGQVAITLWADPDARYKGHVREVSPSADAVTRTYTVKVSIEGARPGVELGMTANVFLGGREAAEVIRLPLTALYQKDGQPAVWVVDPQTSQVALTPVKLARYTEDAVEIAAGLKAGDVVVRAGVHKLNAGQKVRALAEAVQ